MQPEDEMALKCIWVVVFLFIFYVFFIYIFYIKMKTIEDHYRRSERESICCSVTIFWTNLCRQNESNEHVFEMFCVYSVKGKKVMEIFGYSVRRQL